MELAQRLNNTNVLRTYQNMIRTLPLDIVRELKANLESEPLYFSHRFHETLDKEFSERLK